MDIILDGKILAEFKRKAKENFEQEQKDGRLVQLLCYFIGRTYIYENGTKQLIDGITGPPERSGLPGRVPVVFEGFKAKLFQDIF